MKQIVLLLAISFFSFTYIQTQTEEEKSLHEYNSGQVSKFSSNGEGKSEGLKIHFKYPKSWESVEGEHQYVVRKFLQSDHSTLAMIIVVKQEKEPTQSELNEVFTTDGLKSILPSTFNYISINTNIKIEGLRAGKLEFTNSDNRMGIEVYSFTQMYVFWFKNYCIQVQCSVNKNQNETKENANNRFQNAKPLFDQMLNSLVIDKY